MLRFQKGVQGFHCQTIIYSEWIWPTDLVIIHNSTFLEIFMVLEVTKLWFLLTKCHLLFTRWNRLMQNSTTAKEQKNSPVNAFKKSNKLSFVTSGTEKLDKKGRWFPVFPLVFHFLILLLNYTFKSDEIYYVL